MAVLVVVLEAIKVDEGEVDGFLELKIIFFFGSELQSVVLGSFHLWVLPLWILLLRAQMLPRPQHSVLISLTHMLVILLNN